MDIDMQKELMSANELAADTAVFMSARAQSAGHVLLASAFVMADAARRGTVKVSLSDLIQILESVYGIVQRAEFELFTDQEAAKHGIQ